MSTIILLSGLEIDREAVADACRQFGVRRLEMFGSALTDTFDMQRSDIDLLVTFEFEDWQGRADRYFGLLETLESIFGRPIDLLTEQAIRNPYLRAEIDRARQSLYPQP